ncbi:MAG: hypothetical protein K5897_05150 [Eubacterium sp.]|nr:hypothetical protein [Eubacterium sp.]
MGRRALAVGEYDGEIPLYFEVTRAYSFEQAQEMISQAEKEKQPFEALFVTVEHRPDLVEFLDWLKHTGRDYYGVGILEYRTRIRYLIFRMLVRSKYRLMFVDSDRYADWPFS